MESVATKWEWVDDRGSPSPRQRFDRVRAVLSAVVGDASTAAALASAGVTVRIDVEDVIEGTLWLLFDRNPVVVSLSAPPERPAVILRLRAVDLEGMFEEGQYLPLRILSGEVSFDGCVRKFLRVLPLLRGAAAVAEAPAPPIVRLVDDLPASA